VRLARLNSTNAIVTLINVFIVLILCGCRGSVQC
jgi:hypothetical protein